MRTGSSGRFPADPPRTIHAGVLLTVLSSWAATQSAPAMAQGVDSLALRAAAPAASPYLEPDHWAYGAIRQLEALGLLPEGRDRGSWSLDRSEAVALMEWATRAARVETPELLEVLGEYSRRLQEEVGRSAATIGYRGERGVVLAGMGGPDFVEAEPERVPGRSSPYAALDVAARLGPRWAVRAHGVLSEDGLDLGEAYARMDVWKVELWAGRRALRLGAGEGSVILSGASTAGGGGIETDAIRLPWILERIGPIRARMALVRLDEVEPFEHPWLWVVRVGLEPHPRVSLGLNRGAMVAATDQKDAEFVKHLLYVLIGKHGEGELNRQDNQIASVDLSYRPPLGRFPLLLHIEWGLEDSAGAWRDVPAIVGGAYIGAVPGAAWLAVGVEGARFEESCCGNPWWYRHRGFLGGWTEERRPLGHALGGHGTEWSVHATASLLEGAAQSRLRVYHRDRGRENLFAPVLERESTGGRLDVSFRPHREIDIGVSAELEDGGGWSASELRVSLSYLF